jgi:hypothetical protein
MVKSGLGETILQDPPLELTAYMRDDKRRNDRSDHDIILRLNIVDAYDDAQPSEFDSDSDS